MHLLIDGDIVAYQAMAANQLEVECETEEDYWTYRGDVGEAKIIVADFIDGIMSELSADSYTFCMTHDVNWRKSFYGEYKQNRILKRKPCGYKALREWCMETKNGRESHSLEADDLMGIMSTSKTWRPSEKKVICSIDKDMMTIPGWLYNWDKDMEPRLIDSDEARYHHMFQTLCGDSTDGYPGAKGIGKVKATAFLETISHLSEREQWVAVASKFPSEREALRQARMSRILQKGDWLFEERRMVWTFPS